MTDPDKTTPDPPGDPSALPPLVELTFDPHRVLRNIFITCLLINLAFFILDIFLNYKGLATIGSVRRIFNTAREDGLAGWFAVTQTAMLALTLWLLFVTARQQGGSRWRSTGWLVLALFFTYMAADDGAHLHERLGTAFKTRPWVPPARRCCLTTRDGWRPLRRRWCWESWCLRPGR